jgi:hypothetical protein
MNGSRGVSGSGISEKESCFSERLEVGESKDVKSGSRKQRRLEGYKIMAGPPKWKKSREFVEFYTDAHLWSVVSRPCS